MKLNEKILYYRKAARMSQEELAGRLGVSRQAVSKWELGDAVPDVDRLVRLARTFGITVDELLSEEEPKAEDPEDPPVAVSPEAPRDSAEWADTGRSSGLLGSLDILVRRYGWLAGVYIALSGLGTTIFGAIVRAIFGTFVSVGSNMMGSMGGGDIEIDFSGYVPPEVISGLQEELGGGIVSPMSPIENLFMTIANGILVVGLIVLIGGIVLAVILYRKGRDDDSPGI